jgi:glycosyltransferase involved in cell wall biosynthesis
MKILLTIHHELDPNMGAPGVTWHLGQEYLRLGHEVYYYSHSDMPQKFPGIAQSLLFPQFLACHIQVLIQKHAIDVIDASTGDIWAWGKLSYHRRNRPLLVTRSHGLEHTVHLGILEEVKQGNLHLSWKYPFYHGGLRLWEVETSLRVCDLALLLNHYDANYAVNELGMDSAQVRVVANGIPDSFLNLPFEPIPLNNNIVIRIAQIGSYIPRKGIHYGIPALNIILTRYPQVMMNFYGTGCSEAQVHADFDPSVRDRVKVIPNYSREMLPSLLYGSHIKLFPTLSEGFSLSLIEAMACGLAPITTDIPGTPNFFRDNENGILVPPRNQDMIVQALERLIEDRIQLENLRRNAYLTAQNYGWQQIAKNTLALYEQALSQKRVNHLPTS